MPVYRIPILDPKGRPDLFTIGAGNLQEAKTRAITAGCTLAPDPPLPPPPPPIPDQIAAIAADLAALRASSIIYAPIGTIACGIISGLLGALLITGLVYFLVGLLWAHK